VVVLLVCLLAASLFRSVPFLGIVLMALAVFAFLGLGAMLMRGAGEKKYTDPYDLQLLKEIDEREVLRQAGEQRPESDANVLCPHCGHVYAQHYKVCPHCGHAP